ncbi:hypothetical protein HXX76_006316 [Chlamydomonas incerta]|uniref:UBX domain-containing protein n=1 Tax=Chlamydomonas incerta TaxID=51695 RepID=A0A835T0Q1_CHLIN|nr:hypothetical protein HXX76_006316 [Chlamydomonas incerta]|eukprot:KAG2436792.1 hypothetical protein HXX76_006316 [Chlamydomonas incerta]
MADAPPDELAVSRLQMMAHCDEAQARFLLEAAGGNLDLALQMAIENSDMGDAYAHHTQQQFHAPPPAQPRPGSAAFGAPLPPRPRAPALRAQAPGAAGAAGGGAAAGGPPAALAAPLGLLGFVLRVPLMALGLGFRIMRFTVVNGLHAAAVVGDRVLPAPVMRAARGAVSAIATAATGGAELDPGEQAAAFVAEFKSAYGDRHPRWQESGWRVASQQARREFRFLFVYLHSPEHEDTDKFCRQVLTSPDVVDYINANFVSWGGDVSYSDAFILSQQAQMGCTRFPFIALLSLSPHDSRPALVASASGQDIAGDPAALLVLLRTAVMDHGAMLAAARAEMEEREHARRLVEEQDAEYEASLAADRAREAERAEERKRQEEEERKRMAEERAAREAAEAEERRVAEAAAAIERRRADARAALLPEPAAGAEGSTAIRLRLPDGTNTSRLFPAGATLQAVFDYVDSLDATSYSRYHLVSNYPRRVFVRAAHGPASLAELGLVPQAALFVQPDE